MIELANKEQQLKNLEKEIAASSKIATENWIVVGKALSKIRDGKLYKQRTFEQYCLQRWNFKRSYASRLITGYETLKTLPSTEETVDPGQQNQEIPDKAARALKKVPKKQRLKVLKAAKKSGRITPKSIEEAAESIVVDTIEKDKAGRAIPGSIMPLWERRNELNPKLRPLHELLQWATDMQGSDDILFRGFNFGRLMDDLKAVIFTLKQALPEVVCTKCSGVTPDTCDHCYGRGMISLAKARAYTPVEMKKIIDNQTSSDDQSERLSSTGG